MGLRDILKIISDLANTYLIDKPYIVGGLPRDIVMGIPNVKTTDIDITTNSPEVLRLGILLAEHLNVTFDLSDDGHVTVFSDEFDIDFSSNFISKGVKEFLNGKYKGLEEAFSRDFTINTLHQDLLTGEIKDPTEQGFDDIKNKLIKTPVPAKITLSDDPRRIYRAINLAARYNFDLSKDIKDFAVNNPDLFSSENIKDKYISLKISKALKSNKELTLKLLKEMNLLRNIPLSGAFKDIMIEDKLLVDYLNNHAIDKYAFLASNWSQYSSQSPEHAMLSNWWKSNYYKIPGNYNSSYYSWAKWYEENRNSKWGGNHKDPLEVLKIMKKEANPIGPLPDDISYSIIDRKNKLLELLGYSENTNKDYSKKIRVKPGVNIDNITSETKDFIKELEVVSSRLKVETPLITSGWRSIRSQANIMAKNWHLNGGINGGSDYLKNIYGNNYGGSIAEIFEFYGTEKLGIDKAIEVIKNRAVGSFHIKDPAEAIDLSDTNGIKEVLKTIELEGKFNIKILDETNTAAPHWHVHVIGKNQIIANINNRIEKLSSIIKNKY